MAGQTDSGRPAPGALAARLGGAIGIAPEGVLRSAGVAGLGALLFAAGLRAPGAIVVMAAAAIAAFFRDPDRFPARTEGVVISGADGKVTDIAGAAFPGAAGPLCHRVSVFMSPLDVHVNRALAGGEVTLVEHTRGEFRAAFRDAASLHNERNLIVVDSPGGRSFAMLQVAGYLARRIVCRLRVHDRIQPGQRIGLIMFGSRVDHFFPSEFTVTVRIGDHVRAGETVIGELQK